MYKKPYAKIEFKNCGLEYDFTICPWEMVEDQIQSAHSSFEDIEESDPEQPEINITVVYLTDEEWEKEFAKWDR